MMLNACVYIDLQSNASSILPAVTDANSIKGTNPKELRRKKKRVIICNAESPVTMS